MEQVVTEELFISPYPASTCCVVPKVEWREAALCLVPLLGGGGGGGGVERQNRRYRETKLIGLYGKVVVFLGV